MATKSRWTKTNEYGDYKIYRKIGNFEITRKNLDEYHHNIIKQAKALGYGKRAGSVPIGKLINYIKQQQRAIRTYKTKLNKVGI